MLNNNAHSRKLKHDLTNLIFSDLLVLYRTDYNNRKVMWACLCNCGSLPKVTSENLIKGKTKSCGCRRSANASKIFKTHGQASYKYRTKTYTVWTGMKNRCLNKNNHAYDKYGGRGIMVCNRWMKFDNFYADMGEKPEGMSIERTDNSKGYSPENCKWATCIEQANNTRKNKCYEYNGESLTIPQWGRKLSINHKMLAKRIRNGMSIEDAILNPKEVTRLYIYDGVAMPIKDWAKRLGFNRRTLDWRLERGWAIEKAFTTPLRGNL